MANPYGIDLGTTYSCIAQLDNFDKPVVIPGLSGEITTPSVVYFESETDVVVGDEAKNMLLMAPDQTVSLIKRSMGDDTAFDKSRNSFPYHLDPSEISSLILRKLVQDANDSGNADPTTDVVITCPAYFGHKERMQTKQAGELAGLNVLAVINEPTAAAIAYGAQKRQNKTILVYDLGGGTFDVTIIRVENNAINVIATGGNHHLGGADWDLEFARFILEVFNETNGTTYSIDDPIVRAYFMSVAETQKKRLTNLSKTISTNVQFDGLTAKVEFDRSIFDALTEPLLQETLRFTRETIDLARKKGYGNIDEFLLVGGSTLMPQVKAAVNDAFGVDARFSDPHQSVAKGAAIFAKYQVTINEDGGNTGGHTEEPKPGPGQIFNVTSKTYGTDLKDNKVQNMIFANTSLPCEHTMRFTTVTANQRSVSMKVFESDFTDPDMHSVVSQNSCVLIDDHVLRLTRDWPEGTPIVVTFKINSEGMLSVRAYVENDRIDFELRVHGVRTDEQLSKDKDALGGITIG